MEKDAALKEFFESYGVISCSGDLKPLAGFYADSFMVAGPEGSAAFRNDESFVQWLEQLRQANERSGLKSMRIVAFNEFPISRQYKGAAVTWGAQFRSFAWDLAQDHYVYQRAQPGSTYAGKGIVVTRPWSRLQKSVLPRNKPCRSPYDTDTLHGFEQLIPIAARSALSRFEAGSIHNAGTL
ncbi:hypothetical protein [Taibaiella helva]|uniref:hypothetical protein n=1 Tax=Taibaiella helva TaxID=2301235 RepID=UPI001300723F|nr:hypothetical protein [Taibaiella helva]